MKPPHNCTVVELARETGITEVTLRTWRESARAKGEHVPAGEASEAWSGSAKFRVVLETVALSEGERAEYCRAKAILPEQVQQWREACEQANEPENKRSALAALVHGECQSSGRLWSGGCLNLFGFGIPFGVEKYSVGKTPVAHATRPSRGMAHLGVFVERGRSSHQCLVLAPMTL